MLRLATATRHPVMKRLKYTPEQVQVMTLGSKRPCPGAVVGASHPVPGADGSTFISPSDFISLAVLCIQELSSNCQQVFTAEQPTEFAKIRSRFRASNEVTAYPTAKSDQVMCRSEDRNRCQGAGCLCRGMAISVATETVKILRPWTAKTSYTHLMSPAEAKH